MQGNLVIDLCYGCRIAASAAALQYLTAKGTARNLDEDGRGRPILLMHNRLHTRFNVSRLELIRAGVFEAACNVVAAYALEGEWPGLERSRA